MASKKRKAKMRSAKAVYTAHLYGGFKLTSTAIKAQGTRIRICRASGAGDAIDRFAPPKRCYREPWTPTENAPIALANGAYKGAPHYEAPAHCEHGTRPEFHNQTRDNYFSLARALRTRKAY
jgi:hypothetical protein